MFDIYLWIKDLKSGEINVENYRCRMISVTQNDVSIILKDDVKIFDRKTVNMIDFSSRGIKI